ncbi:MAG: phosphocholine cytidylyltransferase family protein [Alphaproteobacteria bacterium]|nr:phosphocholine cytidylyltransferase family protein [Alphaproteobacteria bacterium]
MRGLILAAGRGSRMLAQTSDRPKAFVELHGRRLLDLQLSALRKAGLSEIALVRGYCGQAFLDYDLTLFDNPAWERTNMVMSMLAASEWLRADTTIVSYADIFYPAQAVQRLMKADGDIVIAYDPNWLSLWSRRFADPLSDAETFRIDQAGCLTEIGGKTHDISRIQGQYMGLFRLTPQGAGAIGEHVSSLPLELQAKLDVTSLLSRLIASGTKIGAVAVPGPWGEVDQPSDLEVYTLPEIVGL